MSWSNVCQVIVMDLPVRIWAVTTGSAAGPAGPALT